MLRDRLLAAERQVEDYKAANGLVGTRGNMSTSKV